MKKYSRLLVSFIIIVLLSLSLPMVVSANSAEPPGFTVIVTNPPDDLSISLQFADGSQAEAIVLDKELKVWEAYYRFFYHTAPPKSDLKDAKLLVSGGGQSFQCALPELVKYNNFLALDLQTETLTLGQSELRIPTLVALRVALTLLIEGFIFFLFGYRQKRSWILFLAINIITQTWLNALLTGPNLGSYWMFGFIFIEIVILIVELLAFIGLIKEYEKSRIALYTFIANVASLLLGGFLITYLPI